MFRVLGFRPKLRVQGLGFRVSGGLGRDLAVLRPSNVSSGRNRV